MRRQAFKIKSFSKRAEVKQQSEAMLRRCIELDPTDARAYNALGKHLQLERRFNEAGQVYDDGLAVTGLWEEQPHFPHPALSLQSFSVDWALEKGIA